MKKIFCLVLALIVTVCAFAGCSNEQANKDLSGDAPQTSSDNKTQDETDAKYTAPEGFTLYHNKDIVFAYPSDWTQTEDGSFTSADNTKSITLTTQENSYAGLDTQKYVQKVRPELEAEGKKLVFASAGQKNKDGVDITYITRTFSTNGIDGETYQNIYALDVKGKTYVITVTQPNGLKVDKTLGDKVYESIKVK